MTLLFPLEKNWLNTKFFLGGCSGSQPEKRRTPIPDRSAAARKQHALLMSKKGGWDNQMRHIRKRAEEGMKADRQAASEIKAHIKGVLERVDAESKERQMATAAATREYIRTKSLRQGEMDGAWKQQADDFKNWRTTMQNRVGSMPQINAVLRYSCPTIEQRAKHGIELVNNQTRQYFTEQRARDRETRERGNPSYRVPRKKHMDDIIEENVARGNEEMRNMQFAFWDELDDLDERLENQSQTTQAQWKKDIREAKNRAQASQSKTSDMIKHDYDNYKNWKNDMVNRVQNREKSYGGYHPILESTKRQLIKAAADLL